MIDVLILAGALAQAAQRPSPVDQIEVGVIATFADGSTQTNSRIPGARLVFASAASQCGVPETAVKEPPQGALGWRVDVEVIPGDARIVWKRLESALNHQGAKNGVRTLPIASSNEWTALDHLDIPATAGCKISHWSLVARRRIAQASSGAAGTDEPRLMEAELWFVHRAPDGKETSSRQTLRLKSGTRMAAGGRGEFYFDDMIVNANMGDRTEPVTVEVFGALQLYPWAGSGDIGVSLSLTRRYVNPKAVALGVPPTVGKGQHAITVQPGEVVSFVLPPVEGDKGHFLGHRFSVRLRIKSVSPEGN